MNLEFINWILPLSPIAFIVTALYSWVQPGLRPQVLKRLALNSTILNILIAAVGSIYVTLNGLLESAFIGFNEIGISLRLDALSILMFFMIAIIGFIVVKFSQNYMDGDENQGRFIGRLAATLASVQLLVLAGNLGLLWLAWVMTSISLHRLLVFYPNRPGAIVAARKKVIVARLGDVSLFIAMMLLYRQFDSANLEVIFQGLRDQITLGIIPSGLETSAVLIVLTALLKSAQFPTHGWLIEVMETPTPVSALLHAGILNAGPFLLLRMAFLMELSSSASILIISIAGFTALFASVAFLTQTSIKTALGYSSVAHMGFSLMLCGLGAYPAAMLHMVAHSFYKAHSFLSTGSIIDVIRGAKVQKIHRTGHPIKITLGILLAIAVYLGFAYLWGMDFSKDLALLSIGAIIVMGLSTLFTSALDTNGRASLIIRATLLAIMVAALFFTLESGAHYLLAAQLPEAYILNSTEIILTISLLILFGAVVFIQILSPVLGSKTIYRAIAIHLKNGFYANALFDRLIGALRIHPLNFQPNRSKNRKVKESKHSK
ncbi:MAG: NAD(P)H-quinone oxidoreductase subunit 5 [Salibacteraceae bacterium]|jgi:NAD(P)H-quinone oxidoreductase subunit 5